MTSGLKKILRYNNLCRFSLPETLSKLERFKNWSDDTKTERSSNPIIDNSVTQNTLRAVKHYTHAVVVGARLERMFDTNTLHVMS